MLANDLDNEFDELVVWFSSSETGDVTSPYLVVTATPEPISSLLFILGAACLVSFSGKRRRG